MPCDTGTNVSHQRFWLMHDSISSANLVYHHLSIDIIMDPASTAVDLLKGTPQTPLLRPAWFFLFVVKHVPS